jgi:hypothetical protein
MGKKFQYTTLDRILAKLYRDLGLEDISETDVIEWTGEALEAIGAITLYEEAIACVEVKNHQADLPIGLHSIIQIAKNNRWSPTEENNICPQDFIEEVEEETITCPVVLDCKGAPLLGVEITYYRPYFDLQYEYYGWSNSSYYKENYTPVKLSNHTFFNTLVCAEDMNLYQSCVDEYTIAEDTAKFSFKEGSVVIAYHRQKTDPATGYPMIPDDYSVITAITMYITMKYMSRLWYLGREGYSDKVQKAESDWHWYCKQAGNNLMIPYGIDEHQKMLEGRNNLIPNHNKYYGYFGKPSR